MKKEKVKYIITKTPAEINKVIDKLKDTPEWKSTAKRFTKKVYCKKEFNVKWYFYKCSL